MKIKINERYGEPVELELEKFVRNCIGGDDYSKGAFETVESDIANIKKAFGRLMDVLTKKGLLNALEICHIVSEAHLEYDCENAELIKPESDSVADKVEEIVLNGKQWKRLINGR